MGEKNTFLKITDSVKSTATQLGKAYEDIKETYNTIIDDETVHEKNDSLQNLNESIRDLSMHLYAVKESLIYMEQHYAKTLDDLNESMKRIQSVTETLDERLKNVEETMKSDSQEAPSSFVTELHSSQEQISKDIKAINKQIKSVGKKIESKNDDKDNKLVDEIASLRIAQQQTNKEISSMEELMRLLVLNHLIDEVPSENEEIVNTKEQGAMTEKAEKKNRIDQVESNLNFGHMYEYGNGVDCDYDKAAEYYQQAVWNGCKGAQDDLARIKTKKETFDMIKDILFVQLDIDEDDIVLNADIWDDLNAQPDDFENIIAEAERTFDIEIDEDILSEINTVEELVDSVYNSGGDDDDIRFTGNVAETDIIISNEKGFHARPASLFVTLAREFLSKVQIVANGRTVDAKNVLQIMSLGITKGSKITICAIGDDCYSAVAALRDLIEQDFGVE